MQSDGDIPHKAYFPAVFKINKFNVRNTIRNQLYLPNTSYQFERNNLFRGSRGQYRVWDPPSSVALTTGEGLICPFISPQEEYAH